MKIALDFDGTVTEDIKFWCYFCENARNLGHEVRIVTFRHSDELTNDLNEFLEYNSLGIIFTGRKLKKAYCQSIGWEPDIWIDDTPSLIGDVSTPWTDDQHAEWKKSIEEEITLNNA